MSKVIHKIKPNFNKFNSHLSFNSLLHRGQKSKDPYNNRRLFNPARLLLKTLDTSRIETRCSSTFSGYINNSKNLRITGFSSAFILLILSALSVYPIVRSLNSAEAVTPTNSTTSLSITSTNSASVELLVKSDSGTFASSTTSQELNFNVKTDNYAGYELTLLGKDDSYASLKNSSTNTTLTSISGSKESSEFSNGNWGYTLDGTNYRAAPNNTTGYQIEKTSVPNKDTAKTYTLGIGAKANYSTKAGTYTNTYVLTAVGNSTPYTIYYRDNTNDSSVANLPTTQDEATSAINVNLSDTVPTRTGYTFSKWCDGTVTNNGTTCTGTSYNSGDEFGIDRTAASNVATLYTVWTVNSYTLNITNNNTTSNPATSTTINFGGETTITVTPNAGYYLSEVSCPAGYTCSGYSTGSDYTGSQTVTVKNNGDSTSATDGTIAFTAESSVDGYMQDFTASECDALSDGTTLKLGDKRDGNTYNVTKINGNCWMTQNLRYVGDAGSTSGSMIMKSATSNISADTTISYDDLAEGNSYDVAELHVATSDQVPSGATYTAADMGVWYNYAAASAGTITGSSNTNAQTYDICPKGWRLPTGSDSGEISNIIDYADAFAPITGGLYSGGNRLNSMYGYWWSATVTNNDSAARSTLTFQNNQLARSGNYRSGGYYVRCVKKSTAEEIEYLQDMTPAVADTLATGTTLTLKDKRDENDYKVTKLADGNLWMTQNLRYKGDTVGSSSTTTTWYLKSATTNVTADKTMTMTDLTSGNTYDAARFHDSGSTSTGLWYNYAAASAMTITGSSNSTAASQDICPKGWRLPTNSEQSGITGYASAFSPVAGGYYYNGSVRATGYGYWWSATAYDNADRYLLRYDGSSLNTNNYSRSYGNYVRCILNDSRSAFEKLQAGKLTLQDVGNLSSTDKTTLISAMAYDTTYTATDNRDGQSYQIAKLRDDKIWLVDNLNLGAVTLTTDLTSANTNLSTTITAATWNGHKKSSGTATYTAAEYIPLTGTDSTSGTAYGTLYNYCAASAKTICTSSNSNNASYDICPKGWRLPTGNTSGEFQALYNNTSYNSNAKMRAPVSSGGAAFALAGAFRNSTPANQGSYGDYWSSTRSNNSNMYILHLNTSSVYPASSSDRGTGSSIRCVLK